MDTKKEKKQFKTQWLLVIGYMLIGMVCGSLIINHLNHISGTGASLMEIVIRFVLLFLGIYAAMTVQIVIHEAGHLVFGLATGYRFSSFRVFNLMWIKEKDTIRFKKMSIAGTGGQCLMGPPDLKDGKMPVMLYNFGGALMNLLASLVFAVLALLFPAASFIRVLLQFLVIIGIALALMNGLPLKAGPVNNDGRNALDLSKDPEAIRAFWIQMKVNELISNGTRVKDMPAEWFVMPDDEAMKNGIIATVGVLACSRLMDEKRFAEADQLMERILSTDNGVVGLHRYLLTCDRIYMELIGQNRPEVLEQLLNKEQQRVMKAMKDYPSVLRTAYAYALLSEKDIQKAEKIRKQFAETAMTYPYPSEIESEEELMAIAENKAAGKEEE